MRVVNVLIYVSIFLLGLATTAQAQNSGKMDCSNFEKNADGSWSVVKEFNFYIGSGPPSDNPSAAATTLRLDKGTTFRKGMSNLGNKGMDFFEVLTNNCH